jgi:hypothetical protein
MMVGSVVNDDDSVVIDILQLSITRVNNQFANPPYFLDLFVPQLGQPIIIPLAY